MWQVPLRYSEQKKIADLLQQRYFLLKDPNPDEKLSGVPCKKTVQDNQTAYPKRSQQVNPTKTQAAESSFLPTQ